MLVARIEPPGLAFGMPEGRLREIRESYRRGEAVPGFAPLNPG
jgi:hypothetical protein